MTSASVEHVDRAGRAQIGSGAFYNDISPDACAVLRQCVEDGVIARGVVDQRSITELQPHDLAGFSQIHLFAGGGLWSIAARLAGWPDDRPLWTASCPCQPFSQAGRRRGRADERHLWPDVHRLVAACRPAVVVGEQVAGAAGRDWFDGVAADLGGLGYACRAVDLPAAAVDAPHIRRRLYWIALADPDRGGRRALGRDAAERPDGVTLGDAERARLEGQRRHGDDARRWSVQDRSTAAPDGGVGDAPAGAIASRNGSYWSGVGWIVCHDGKARRAEPGIRLLADGISCPMDLLGRDGVPPARIRAQVESGAAEIVSDCLEWRRGRVDLWRVAGNAIVPELAALVLRALKAELSTGRAA